jgi:hypothetical protein
MGISIVSNHIGDFYVGEMVRLPWKKEPVKLVAIWEDDPVADCCIEEPATMDDPYGQQTWVDSRYLRPVS